VTTTTAAGDGAAPVAQPARSSAAGSGWRSAPARATTVLTIHPEEYGYVYADLKRIAVLAVSIFAVLILLSFIIK
jgi:hypothetical protein